MSNAPKTGFWHSIPGLITATAGFLSAATGAIVALNQTGVVDLKKVAGTKPPEQVTPLVNSSAPASPNDKKPGLELSAGGGAAEPKQQDVSASSKPIAPSEPVRLPDTTAQRPDDAKPSAVVQSPPATANKSPDATPPPVVEPKPQPSQSSSTADTEKLKAIREGAAAVPSKQEDQLPTVSAPATPKREVPPPTPAAERVAEIKHQPVKPAPSASARETEKTAIRLDPKPVEAAPQVVKAPPSPAGQDKAAPHRPDPKERIVDARNPDRDSDRPATAEDDTRRAKIVRPPSGAVDSRSGSTKRLATDDDPVVRPAPGAAHEVRSTGAGDRQLDLTGLRMTLPPGWVKDDMQSGPMAPVAALKIHDPAGDGVVHISRYLGAKGKELEERSIERWVGQVTKAGGAPASRADAKIERIQVGPVRITTVDLSGTVKMSPRDAGDPASRMVSAIIDHPAGPHLVTIVGPARSMAKWDAAIEAFLRSAKPE